MDGTPETGFRLMLCFGGNLNEMRRILFYTDSVVYGGHEEMFLRHLAHLPPGSFDSLILYGKGNREMELELASLAKQTDLKINAVSVPHSFSRLDQLLSLISIWRLWPVFSYMRRFNPEVVCVVAGRIEGGSVGLMAAFLLRIPRVLYVPLVHLRTSWRPGLLSEIRDRINLLWYRRYDRIICISTTQKAELERRGLLNIEVVDNSLRSGECGLTRREVLTKIRLGYLGRIVREQKNVTQIPRIIKKATEMGLNISAVLQGSGADLLLLKNLSIDLGIADRIQILEWSKNIGQFFAEIDVLFIPSKYEGVPLVMLEALQRGIPVIATNVDGMADWLPEQWLFPYNDDEAVVRLLASRCFMNNMKLNELSKKVRERCNPVRNGRMLCNSVTLSPRK